MRSTDWAAMAAVTISVAGISIVAKRAADDRKNYVDPLDLQYVVSTCRDRNGDGRTDVPAECWPQVWTEDRWAEHCGTEMSAVDDPRQWTVLIDASRVQCVEVPNRSTNRR